MKQEKFKEALEQYNKAIEIDASNAVYYCNRAAAY
jgi:small glutamine-rich tetratricopeptide repeat-containing protein alpha